MTVKSTLTSLVSTMPLTYLPSVKWAQKTLNSTARYTSLSPARASIFRSHPLSLFCSRGSAKPESGRERARRNRYVACTSDPPDLSVATGARATLLVPLVL